MIACICIDGRLVCRQKKNMNDFVLIWLVRIGKYTSCLSVGGIRRVYIYYCDTNLSDVSGKLESIEMVLEWDRKVSFGIVYMEMKD